MRWRVWSKQGVGRSEGAESVGWYWASGAGSKSEHTVRLSGWFRLCRSVYNLDSVKRSSRNFSQTFLLMLILFKELLRGGNWNNYVCIKWTSWLSWSSLNRLAIFGSPWILVWVPAALLPSAFLWRLLIRSRASTHFCSLLTSHTEIVLAVVPVSTSDLPPSWTAWLCRTPDSVPESVHPISRNHQSVVLYSIPSLAGIQVYWPRLD